jgi:hypothetical protein
MSQTTSPRVGLFGRIGAAIAATCRGLLESLPG